jgi:hypothetical protein
MANRLIAEILKNRDRFISPINKIDLSLFLRNLSIPKTPNNAIMQACPR